MASVLRAHGAAVRESLPFGHRRLLDAVCRCRTPALGGHVEVCEDCGHRELRFNSCRDRHCPTCSAGRTRKWLLDRQDKLLPVPHFQVVFTLPEQLRVLAQAAPRVLYGALMDAAASSLQDVLRTRYQARFSVTAVLHTWTRELLLHPHVHLLVSAGGLSLDDQRWIATPKAFLVSTRQLAPVFAARVLAALREAELRGELDLRGRLASELPALLRRSAKKTWVVHVEPPQGRGPEVILRYLARYLFRVALDDRRLLGHDGQSVTIRTRGKATTTMSGADFVRRFAQHALPRGFRKVRQYGLLAPANVRARLARAFELLGGVEQVACTAPPVEPAPDPTWDPRSDDLPPGRCSACGQRAVRRHVLEPVRGPPVWSGSQQRKAS